ncbi:LOW QUALITY PROTEIN: protein MTSS 1 [Embiotoca jacksoni]|uniref:LOW QUALITY PROTEIN: protein MTSS 1 n=1 Tax=Embiotoca jacksoni TaxID=100190 RepID=UPI003704BBC7
MDAGIEKECSALGGLFQLIMNDMKASYPTWEDFVTKGAKLQSQLRTTIVVTGAFLDAFQKVADMATGTRGATKEIGSALTRMCMRHRSIECKLKLFTTALSESLITPLELKMEEWKKVASQLDKDHAKEYKKARADIKKKSSDTIKLQKKVKKGKDEVRGQLDSALQDVNERYAVLEDTEKRAVCRALVEERARYCGFVGMLKPVLDHEINMLGEVTHLQTILEDLTNLTAEPNKLPPASEQVKKTLPAVRRDPPLYVDDESFSLHRDADSISLHHISHGNSQSDFDKSSTIPRNSDLRFQYREFAQSKRPASTVNLLTESELSGGSSRQLPSHTATIRRKPSSKPAYRRGTISGGVPIPICTPQVPLKAIGGGNAGSDENVFAAPSAGGVAGLGHSKLCTSTQSLSALPPSSSPYYQLVPGQMPIPVPVPTIPSLPPEGSGVKQQQQHRHYQLQQLPQQVNHQQHRSHLQPHNQQLQIQQQQLQQLQQLQQQQQQQFQQQQQQQQLQFQQQQQQLQQQQQQLQQFQQQLQQQQFKQPLPRQPQQPQHQQDPQQQQQANQQQLQAAATAAATRPGPRGAPRSGPRCQLPAPSSSTLQPGPEPGAADPRRRRRRWRRRRRGKYADPHQRSKAQKDPSPTIAPPPSCPLRPITNETATSQQDPQLQKLQQQANQQQLQFKPPLPRQPQQPQHQQDPQQQQQANQQQLQAAATAAATAQAHAEPPGPGHGVSYQPQAPPPSSLDPNPERPTQDGGGGDGGEGGGGNVLTLIKGVKLKRTLTNDRSAPFLPPPTNHK